MSMLNRLRCELRAINIEYSALVRGNSGKAAHARMAELCAERRALMALIAVERRTAALERALEHAHSRPRRPALPRELAS
jgi:hypothetical protein